MLKFILLSSLLIVQLQVASAEECLAHNNTPGVCTIDSECVALISSKNNKTVRDSIMQRRCGFRGRSMIVCCPTEIGSRIGLNSEPSRNQDSDRLGEDCMMFDNTPGICTLDLECSLTALSKLVRVLTLRRCGFKGRSMIVCCPISSDISSKPLDRKSDRACKAFGKRPVEVTSRVIGGAESSRHEFPQFAALGYLNDETGEISFDCGGVLISNMFIITAAHCCRSAARKPCVARIGKASINDPNDDYADSDFQVKRIIMHPGYGSFKKYNDIALVELIKKVRFSFEIWPACLIQQETVENESLMIAGFGQISEVDTTLKSNVLLKAIVEEVALERCRYRYKKAYGDDKLVVGLPEGIKDTLLCARNRSQHADTCRGDSGTGLFLLQNEIYFVAGVTSFGVSCNTSLPAFYTRVWKYLDWIESIVWPDL